MYHHPPISPLDPQGYYAVLGVGPLAAASEIKAAYRREAMRLHPDHNPSEAAKADFIRLNDAYQVLRTGRSRARYDETARKASPAGTVDLDDPDPHPLFCSRCGKVTAQPRYIIFEVVQSFLLSSKRTPIQGIFCRDCADRTAIKASTATWCAGWWSLFGPFRALGALITNLLGGRRPRADNFALLLHQARAFGALNETDIALGLVAQAGPFAASDGDRARIAQAARSFGQPGHGQRRLKDRWRSPSYAFALQALPLAALLIALLVSTAALMTRGRADTISAAIAPPPAASGEVRHVAVDTLKVRQGPGENEPTVALLDHFAAVTVVQPAAGGLWAKIRTGQGVVGYVPTRFLFGGSGAAARQRWCAAQGARPPVNGEILMRQTGGDHRLAVRNATGRDVVLHLKTAGGESLLTVFVAKDAEAMVDGIPDGTFQAVYAAGEGYNKACGTFLDGLHSLVLSGARTFQAGSDDDQTLLLSLAAGEEAGRPLAALGSD